jgi:hypothetical protein
VRQKEYCVDHLLEFEMRDTEENDAQSKHGRQHARKFGGDIGETLARMYIRMDHEVRLASEIRHNKQHSHSRDPQRGTLLSHQLPAHR